MPLSSPKEVPKFHYIRLVDVSRLRGRFPILGLALSLVRVQDADSCISVVFIDLVFGPSIKHFFSILADLLSITMTLLSPHFIGFRLQAFFRNGATTGEAYSVTSESAVFGGRRPQPV